MLFVSKTYYLNTLTQKFKISLRSTLATVFTLVRLNGTYWYEHLGLLVLTEQVLKYTEKDATAIRKHCHENKHCCSVDNFEIVGTAVNDFHLKLKESLLILKMKSCSNIAQESLPLYLFDNDSWNAIGK